MEKVIHANNFDVASNKEIFRSQPFGQLKVQEKKSKRADTQANVSPKFGIYAKHANKPVSRENKR
jgi:hypothetical protein